MSPNTGYASETNVNKLRLTPLLERPGRSFPPPYRDAKDICVISSPRETWTPPVKKEEAEENYSGTSEAAQEGEAFSFWDETSEDIYDWSDGEEV